MKPDQDAELLKMQDKFRRCDACMEKYPTVDDSVCDTCNINPIKTDDDLKRYVDDAFKNPATFGLPLVK